MTGRTHNRLITSLGVVVFALLTRWRCKSRRRDALPSATGRFRQQQLEPGTVYLPRVKPPTHCCSSGERQKHTFSTSRFWTNLRTIADSRTSQCSQHACLIMYSAPATSRCGSVTLILSSLIIIIIIIAPHLTRKGYHVGTSPRHAATRRTEVPMAWWPQRLDTDDCAGVSASCRRQVSIQAISL